MASPAGTDPASKHESRQSKETRPSQTCSELNIVTVSHRRFWALSIGLYLGLFISIMDASVVASALHTVALEFEVLVSVNWVALAYTLGECSCCVSFARLSDVIGRRMAFLLANIMFLASSLGCGFSRNLTQLVAFRALQGVGGAGLCSLSLVILPEVCPDQLMEIGAGLSGGIVVAAFIAGPILGGILTQYASWRWIFWINGPICVVSLTTLLLFWPKAGDTVIPPRRSWRSFDFIGSFLVISASVLLVFPFQNVGVSLRDVWSEAIFIAPLVLGIACLFILLAWEYVIELGNLSPRRIMPAFPLSLLRNRHYASGASTTLLLGFPILLTMFSVPLRAQLVSDKSPLVASLDLLPMLGATAAGSIAAVLINFKKAYIFESLLSGALCSLVGCALLTTICGSDDDKKLAGYLVILGLGAGLSVTVATLQTAVAIAPRHYASAQGIISQARVLGGTFGIATSSVLLHNEIGSLITGPLPPELLSSLGEVKLSLSPALQSLVKEACAKAFRDGTVIATIICAFAVLSSFIGYTTLHPNPRQYRIEMIRADALERDIEQKMRC